MTHVHGEVLELKIEIIKPPGMTEEEVRQKFDCALTNGILRQIVIDRTWQFMGIGAKICLPRKY